MLKFKYFFQQSWLLIVASFCFGLLIAVTNAALSEKIEQNKVDKINSTMQGLIPDANKFEFNSEFDITSAKGKKVKTNLYEALSDANDCMGWAFNCIGPGFADKIELIVAVDKEFMKIKGFDCIQSNETPGFGDKIKNDYYRNQFKGVPAVNLELVKMGEPAKIDSEIVAISGATVSSEAVVKIINNSITQVKEQMVKKGLIADGK